MKALMGKSLCRHVGCVMMCWNHWSFVIMRSSAWLRNYYGSKPIEFPGFHSKIAGLLWGSSSRNDVWKRFWSILKSIPYRS
jgi:hypothetical protein